MHERDPLAQPVLLPELMHHIGKCVVGTGITGQAIDFECPTF